MGASYGPQDSTASLVDTVDRRSRERVDAIRKLRKVECMVVQIRDGSANAGDNHRREGKGAIAGPRQCGPTTWNGVYFLFLELP